ncbi:MAG: DinB family protein, partial [Chitinophagaceae bacterium]
MAEKIQTEFWLSGPIEGIASVLQPVAHAILQSQREVNNCMENFSNILIWQQPAGVASVAFHLQHIAGVADRLFTYARGEEFSNDQLIELQKEGKQEGSVDLTELLKRLNEQVDRAMDQLTNTNSESVLQTRYVGRKKIPSNVLGLLFHAAEHMQRHTGQLI